MPLEIQDNPSRSLLFVGAADPEASGDDTPAAGNYRLVIDDTGIPWIVDETGTATLVAAASGAVATDAIWDAAGDLAVGSGANTAAKLAIGATNGMAVMRVSGAVAWALPQGHEIDYVQITTSTTHTATTAATATTAISSNAIAYDGSTRIRLEVFTPGLEAPNGADSSIVLELYDGATDIGRIAIATAPDAGQHRGPGIGVLFLTPSAATHTYHIKGWVTTGTGTFVAGAGGANTFLPAYLRITKA